MTKISKLDSALQHQVCHETGNGPEATLVIKGGNRPFAADAKETKDFPKAVIYFQTSDSKPN